MPRQAARDHGGSSPRVRGRPIFDENGNRTNGLIPACAGQTVARPSSPCSARAHPRVCGADAVAPYPASFVQGSSPRVRGRPVGQCRARPRRGLIPACAGQTNRPNVRRNQGRAHLRVCGADFASASVCTVVVGSSPRVRGRLPTLQDGGLFVGLIPACAGQTMPTYWPREYTMGSSPRVRGRPASDHG